MNNIKCEICGKFISYSDIEKGIATHKLVQDDNEFGPEICETFCREHKSPTVRILENPSVPQSPYGIVSLVTGEAILDNRNIR